MSTVPPCEEFENVRCVPFDVSARGIVATAAGIVKPLWLGRNAG
jgi:hypothetical protein